MSQEFRSASVRTLTSKIGVYGLVDLDGVPLYIGQSVDGIRARVQRHLTSARSDIVANRQIDIWEVAEVWAWPTDRDYINDLEAAIFSHYDAISPLMNGSIPICHNELDVVPPEQVVAIMTAEERARRRQPEIRLPRQIEHYQRLVDYILVVKDAPHLRRSVDAHYSRLSRYHANFLHRSIQPTGSEDSTEP